MKVNNFGFLAVIVAAVLWSADGLIRRHLYDLPAPVIVFWEHLFGTLVLFPIVALSWKQFKELTGRQWLSIILTALLSGALGTMLYTSALQHVQFISFSVVVLLQQLQPVFAITASRVLLKESLTKRYLVLAFFALVGAYFVAFPELRVNMDTGSGTVIAALLAVGAAACWGVSTALSKYTLKDTSTVHVTSLRFLFTIGFAFAAIVMMNQLPSIAAIEFGQWKYIVFITFSTGMAALLLYYYGLKRIKATHSTLLELTWPLSAALIGFFFLGERLTVTQWVGALVLLGVMGVIAKKDLVLNS